MQLHRHEASLSLRATGYQKVHIVLNSANVPLLAGSCTRGKISSKKAAIFLSFTSALAHHIYNWATRAANRGPRKWYPIGRNVPSMKVGVYPLPHPPRSDGGKGAGPYSGRGRLILKETVDVAGAFIWPRSAHSSHTVHFCHMRTLAVSSAWYPVLPQLSLRPRSLLSNMADGGGRHVR